MTPIKDCQFYFITKEGNVWSSKTNRFLKTGVNNPGYKFVYLMVNKKPVNKSIHRLVAQHFVENKENKPWVNHIDGNKQNNHYLNLEWSTRVENIQHGLKTGLIPTGGLHHYAKEVIDVVTGQTFGTLREAAESIGMKRSTLSKMLSGINRNRTNFKYSSS